MSSKPLIGVTACRQQLGKHPSHTVFNKYVEAATHAGMPLILPALASSDGLDSLLDALDGILFTGSPSNIEPHNYGSTLEIPDAKHDPHRDALTLTLIRSALDKGVPIFCICRGFQELNVSLGGTLHQAVHTMSGFMDHREPSDRSPAETYEARHIVTVSKGGFFDQWELPSEFQVNSLHGQGIGRLSSLLRIEALAPDGLVEAASVTYAKNFSIAVQWHPEWRFTENPVSLKLFDKFKEACEERAASKNIRR